VIFMYARLKNLRKTRHLSQTFVAKKLNIPRTALVAIESNKRKISAEELKNFSELYNVSLDEIMYGTPKTVADNNTSRLVEKFSTLSTSAQNEILNFVDFKMHYQT
jgi:transcriptional regulator with XRE-family HTH domain